MSSILIVEDDAPLSNGIVLTLQDKEQQFTQCFNISTAKKRFWERAFDLIILDINLPDGSGLKLCRWIRKSSDVPILFLTANDTELDIVSGFEMGGDDYITKPFSLAILRARVTTLLRRRGLVSAKILIDRFVFDFEQMIFEKDKYAARRMDNS